ncbi:hypothetical protein ACKRZS_002996 [Fusarium odoratissimum]
MATAQVVTPKQVGPWAKAADVASNVMKPAPAGFVAGDPKAIASQFILNDQAFVDLQLYIRAALMLPGSNVQFDMEFPETLFRDWLAKDKKGDLYNQTKSTLVDIFARCYNFQNNTVDRMLAFTDKLLKFSLTEDERVAAIAKHRPVVEDENLVLSDPKVKAAIGAIWSACQGLIADASAAEAEASKLVEVLRQFHTDTVVDATRVEDIQRRTNAVFPSPDDISRSASTEYQKLHLQLKKMYDDQLEASRRIGWPNSGALIYINSIGSVMYCNDKQTWDKFAEIDRSLQQTWGQAEKAHQNAIRLSAKTDSLKTMIKRIGDTINKAINALDKICKDFVSFKGELEYIQTKIKGMKGAMEIEVEWLRGLAFAELDAARISWNQVRIAASYYREHGVLLKNTDKENLEALQRPPPAGEEVELLGATFGGINVTKLAISLYSRGTSIEVPGVVRDFSDPWMNVEKTYTMLYRVGSEHRVFASKEYAAQESFIYTFRKDFGKSTAGSSHHNRVTPRQAPNDCPIEILAVIWGPEKRDQQSVIDYVYRCVNNAPGIVWSNEKLGGDSWPHTQKTGVIYYRRKGTDKVQLLVGREREVTQFNA